MQWLAIEKHRLSATKGDLFMSRIHADRLNAKRAHQAFGAGTKEAIRELCHEVPHPSVLPAEVRRFFDVQLRRKVRNLSR
jgi:hypothetical protein